MLLNYQTNYNSCLLDILLGIILNVLSSIISFKMHDDFLKWVWRIISPFLKWPNEDFQHLRDLLKATYLINWECRLKAKFI